VALARGYVTGRHDKYLLRFDLSVEARERGKHLVSVVPVKIDEAEKIKITVRTRRRKASIGAVLRRLIEGYAEHKLDA
jgi:hypothetical protein